jgi:hypothetical protein
MHDRPPKLPFNASWVLQAAPADDLSWGEKGVWLMMRAFQDRPEGCFLTAAQLGVRTGLTPETAESYRRRLRKLGLLVEIPRKGERSMWFATLPADCIPSGPIPEGRQFEPALAELAKNLSKHIQQAESGCESGPNGNSVRIDVRSESAFGPNRRSGSLSPTPISELVLKHKLPSHLQGEKGVGAIAPESEVGGDDKSESGSGPNGNSDHARAIELRERVRQRRTAIG